VVPEAWTMLFEDFRETPPAFFIDTAPANIDRYGNYPVEQYPELLSYLAENYTLDREINRVLVYRRISPQ
jgi:hypothetical protein